MEIRIHFVFYRRGFVREWTSITYSKTVRYANCGTHTGADTPEIDWVAGQLEQWSATTGPRPGAGPCEVCYRSVCVFRINALSLKHFYNARRNFGTFL